MSLDIFKCFVLNTLCYKAKKLKTVLRCGIGPNFLEKYLLYVINKSLSFWDLRIFEQIKMNLFMLRCECLVQEAKHKHNCHFNSVVVSWDFSGDEFSWVHVLACWCFSLQRNLSTISHHLVFIYCVICQSLMVKHMLNLFPLHCNCLNF